LDGADYMPGLVGMNNMKRNDYLNVVLQCLLRVELLRFAPKCCCACSQPVYDVLCPLVHMARTRSLRSAQKLPSIIPLSCPV
jgi:hypothetical protein